MVSSLPLKVWIVAKVFGAMSQQSDNQSQISDMTGWQASLDIPYKAFYPHCTFQVSPCSRRKPQKPGLKGKSHLGWYPPASFTGLEF